MLQTSLLVAPLYTPKLQHNTVTMGKRQPFIDTIDEHEEELLKSKAHRLDCVKRLPSHKHRNYSGLH